MKILITGGAGFIGSHLAERLLAAGHNVTVIDDLSTGSVENVRAYRTHPNYTLHCETIFSKSLMAELVDAADIIFHLAAAVGVKRIIEMPVRTIETNVAGTEIVLGLAAKKQKRVIIASTSEVYGKSKKVPFSESDDLVFGATVHARWGYACSKAIDEFLALAYFRERQLPVTIVRFFNTVGPRQTGQYGMVVPTFVAQALSQSPITVYGTGEQSRCFGHVFDIIDGLMAVMASSNTQGEIFNLGNTEEVTINQLAERVIALTNSSSKIVRIPYSEAYAPGFEDMSRRVPDISKAEKHFGYGPKRNLNQILSDVITYVEEKTKGQKLPREISV